MTQNTSPVLAGVQTIFTVPRNLWLATSGSVGGESRKSESGFPVACQGSAARAVPRRWSRGGGVAGEPVFCLLLKSFILRTPKKLVFESYGNRWLHTCSSPSWKVFSLLSTPSFFFSFFFLLLPLRVPALCLVPGGGGGGEGGGRSSQPAD